jgi:hypothetical protein
MFRKFVFFVRKFIYTCAAHKQCESHTYTAVPVNRCILNANTCQYIRENQQMHQLLFNLLVIYSGSYMFRHYIAILRERP